MNSEQELFHWYNFCVMYQAGMGVTYRSVSCGFADQRVTTARMSFAKANAGAPDDATIISASYLGLMTRKEFEG